MTIEYDMSQYACIVMNMHHLYYKYSRMLLTFPHAENSCEINPSYMIFMISNFAKCI